MATNYYYYSECGSPAEAVRRALHACGIEDSEKAEVPEVLHALSAAGWDMRAILALIEAHSHEYDALLVGLTEQPAT